jgi:hypothetical protein
MMEVFKQAASKSKEIKPKELPFIVKKDHLSLTTDSNLVYYLQNKDNNDP